MSGLELRPYQREAINAIYDYWESGGGNGVVVIPTGGGKSLVIASLLREMLGAYPDMRAGSITHVKELIAQNFQELIRSWPQAPAGIYSAGIGRRDAHARIPFLGIQSAYNKSHLIGGLDLALVDEAHLISPNGTSRYAKFFEAQRKLVRDQRILGFTATPYRMDSGLLAGGKGSLFDDVIYEVSVLDLIEQGHLSPLRSKNSSVEIDTSRVHIRGGEFVEAELAAAAEGIVGEAVAEIAEYGRDRRGWLIFCCNVAHAVKVRDAVRGHGITCEVVLGDTPSGERDRIINAYKRKEIRCLASVGVLTTGFNAPHVDLVALLRSTLSTGLYVQMVGRGFRLAHGKDDCLILDFGGNVRRHGPVDAPKPKRGGGKTGEQDEITVKADRDAELARACPQCRELVPIQKTSCHHCGHEWPLPEVKHQARAETVPILSTQQAEPEWVDVSDVQYRLHEKEGSPDSVVMTVASGIKSFRQWLCYGHMGRARQLAIMYWQQAGGQQPAPRSAEEALDRVGELKKPIAIRTLKKKGEKYHEIISFRFPVPVAEAAE